MPGSGVFAWRSPLADPQYLGLLSAGIEKALEDSAFGSIRVFGHDGVGTARRLKDALSESEDSENLNTSFVERLNLTIRQGSAYLRRRSPCHARCEDQLREHVELLRCHYNFVRPHGALKFGRETRTPAMQAGLVSKRMTWRAIFTARGLSPRLFAEAVRVFVTVQATEFDAAELPTISWPQHQRTARLINSEWHKHPRSRQILCGTIEALASSNKRVANPSRGRALN